VVALVEKPPMAPGPGPLLSQPTTWASRAVDFMKVLDAAVARCPV